MASPLSTKLSAMLAVLRDACERAGTDEISYSSEWLGWLPFGVASPTGGIGSKRSTGATPTSAAPCGNRLSGTWASPCGSGV